MLALVLGAKAQDNEPLLSLDELIAIATKPVPSSRSAGYDLSQPQQDAIKKIRDMPTYTVEDEAKIVATFQKLRRSPDGIVADGAMWSLGHRNHQELLPEFFSEIVADSDEYAANRVRSFVRSLPGEPPSGEPPLALLRQGLENSNANFRRVVLEVIDKFKAGELRQEIESHMLGDPEESIRVAAASLLATLGIRESVPALRRAVQGSPRLMVAAAKSLALLGSDADLDMLLPLLKSPSKEMRGAILSGLNEMQLADPHPVADALVPLLDDPARSLRIAAMKALGKLRDPRALPAIQALLKSKKPPHGEEADDIIRALGSIGDDASVALLNTMWLNSSTVQQEVLRIAHPSSGYAAWDAYLCDPIKANPGSDVLTTGNNYALRMLETLADEEIFRAIRIRSGKQGAVDWEKGALEELAGKLALRFPKVAAEPFATLQSKAPDKPSDRDKDGVPDRRDKYPDDNRRSEDIPVKQFAPAVYFPTKYYGVISLADEGPASRDVLFMALDDDNRTGWITKVNDLDPPDYHVASSNVREREEWPLPNPGNTPGVYRLDPLSVNSQGTVVGTASRRKVAIPLRQDVREAHVTFQSGFVFEQGRLRFDPPPPFTGEAPNVSYRRINNRGVIFGHREMKIRDGGNDVFRTFAFLGDHVFRDVPVFDVTAMTDAGQLLCFRFEKGKQQSFVWDGAVFHDLGSLAGKPEAVRAYALNGKLQAVGLADALDKDRCPVGFFWENGKMRVFSDLIPAEFRQQLRSAIPYLINDSGSISFRAEEKAGPFPQFWPKRDFILELGKDGDNHVSVQHFGSGVQEDE